MDRKAWCAVGHGVAKSQTWLSDWTELKVCHNFSSNIIININLASFMFAFYFFNDGYWKNWNDRWLASYFLILPCSGQCVRHYRITDVNTACLTPTGGSQGSSDLREKEKWTMRVGQRSLPCSPFILPRNCLIPICSQCPLWWWLLFIGLYTEERETP